MNSAPPPRFPAFKEWQIIVEALAAGEQCLILRKGGIAEGRNGFNPVRADRFWLFPTHFHAQREKTKPAAARRPTTPPAGNAPVALIAYAEVVRHAFLADWERVAALDCFHRWTEQAVREKFDWGRPHGLHALVVRVRRVHTPLFLKPTPEMGGCKSWIDLPCDFDAFPSSPALGDEAFARLAIPV
jgi:hypothetical protein